VLLPPLRPLEGAWLAEGLSLTDLHFSHRTRTQYRNFDTHSSRYRPSPWAPRCAGLEPNGWPHAGRLRLRLDALADETRERKADT
jgi:hypothetical protein